MWSFDLMRASNQLKNLIICLTTCLFLSACQFQPLYGDRSGDGLSSGMANVGVASVNTRVGQQVRNHLLFLMHGGGSLVEKTYEARLRVTSQNRRLAAIRTIADSTAGTVIVTVTYDLVELSSGESIASGTRQGAASYDRTGQVFANERAVRDAENRASREAAEAVRFAIASDLSRRAQPDS